MKPPPGKIFGIALSEPRDWHIGRISVWFFVPSLEHCSADRLKLTGLLPARKPDEMTSDENTIKKLCRQGVIELPTPNAAGIDMHEIGLFIVANATTLHRERHVAQFR